MSVSLKITDENPITRLFFWLTTDSAERPEIMWLSGIGWSNLNSHINLSGANSPSTQGVSQLDKSQEDLIAINELYNRCKDGHLSDIEEIIKQLEYPTFKMKNRDMIQKTPINLNLDLEVNYD